MRSLTRVSVLMGPPLLGFYMSCGDDRLGRSGKQRRKSHTTSKKALHKQGPMPTGRGFEPPAPGAEKAP